MTFLQKPGSMSEGLGKSQAYMKSKSNVGKVHSKSRTI